MSYLLSTDAWLYVMTSEGVYPEASCSPDLMNAAAATRAWAENVDSDLIHVSIITYGEVLVIHGAARSNLSLQYELQDAIDILETISGEDRVLNLTREDMAHWSRIYGALGSDPQLSFEDSYVLAQALCQGYTYVGCRTEVISSIENIGLNFLDPEEWQSLQDEI